MTILEENTLHDLGHNEFELPVGYTDGDGVLHKRVTLREMTGEVDEAIADQKIRSNPGKVVTEAILGVVEKLGTVKKVNRDIVRKLTNTDRDFILAMNHIVSIGDEAEWTEECPKCFTKYDASIGIETLPVKYMTDDEPRESVLELPVGIKDAEGNVYKKLRVSLPTGEVQEKVMPTVHQNPNQALTQMLAMITEEVEGLSHWNFITFQKMTKRDRKYITTELGKIEVGISLTPKVSCADCGHSYTTTIPVMTLLGE